MATVLVTGLVVANWSGRQSDKTVVDVSPGRAAPRMATSPAAAGVPTQSAIDTCKRAAAAKAGHRENLKDAVIAGAIGSVADAAVCETCAAVLDGARGP